MIQSAHVAKTARSYCLFQESTSYTKPKIPSFFASQKNTIENKINDNITKHKNIDNELTNLKRSSDTLSHATSDKRSRKIESEISKLSEQRKKIENVEWMCNAFPRSVSDTCNCLIR